MSSTEAPRPVSFVRWVWLLAVITAAGCNNQVQEPQGQRPLVGLADFHSHQFGGLGFGGHVVSHSTEPEDSCLPILPFASQGNRVQDIVRNQMFREATEQAARGECYPSYSSWVGQRTDTSNLERAWRYGLRLYVVLAVSNEFLCRVGNLGDNDTCPSDQQAIERQLQAAKDLEAKIDAASGGPGMGWYRIVRTPEEARQVIGAGKLAVVLGTEAVNAFGCRVLAREVVSGVRNLGGERPEEQAWRNACGATPSYPEFPLQRALGLFERYWQLGARHFFPIHNMDGVAGGTAMYIPMLHSDTNPTRFERAVLVDRTQDIDEVVIALRPPFATAACSQFEFDRPAGTPGRCNALGLTDAGRMLIRMMASYGAVIDIDHMSIRARNEVLASDGLLGGVYPFISSHSGIASISNGDRNHEGQLTDAQIASMITNAGAFAPILPPAATKAELDTFPPDATVAKHDCGGTSESWVQAYRYIVDKLRNGRMRNGAAAFVGVGFGSDFTAPGSGGPLPRFTMPGPVSGVTVPGDSSIGVTVVTGSGPPGGGFCYQAVDGAPDIPPRLQYPFASTSPLSNGVMFDKSNVPWTGARPTPYDISFDGLAHIGMLPDFVEELKIMGLTNDDLDPLWHGAEAYIRAWEASTAWAGNFTDEDTRGIAQTCTQLRADLVAAGGPGLNAQAVAVLNQLRQTGCLGTP